MKQGSKKGKWLKWTIGTLLLVAMFVTVQDLMRINNYKVAPRKAKNGIRAGQNELYISLKSGEENIDWDLLQGTLNYIDGQYDCSDFQIVNLLRIMYEYGDRIPQDYQQKIKTSLSNFRFWWDCPGTNSMCYWSENHQILFASAEYLVGQYYLGDTLANSGLTGKQHMNRARQRILDWLEMRWKYGFIEFYSEVYYKEDIGAMINLIDFAKDEEIVKKTQIVMDLLLYDVATQNIHGMFVSASGRAYEGNRKGGPRKDLGGLTGYLWGKDTVVHSGMVSGVQYSNKYQLPGVIREIALDSSKVVIRQHSGLDVRQIKTEGYAGTGNRSLMMQLGMEAFTNPEVVRNTLAWMRQTNMFGNDFLQDFKVLDFRLIKWLHLEPTISRLLNPQTNGVAIQSGNIYNYKTNDYSLYSVQDYQPGDYGDQHHVAGMNIRNYFSVFHNHPALEKNIKNQSPNYWVGYGHLPHVAQDSSVSLAIYHLPENKGPMEMDLLRYTHAYFPEALFDTVIIQNNYAFGKKADTYCALIGTHPLSYRGDGTRDDLLQQGRTTSWIIEAGSKAEDGELDKFIQRILHNTLKFDSTSLKMHYQSGGKNYDLTFKGDFLVNEQQVNINYPRYDSPYSKADRKPEQIIYRHEGKSLLLDFYKMIREER